MKNQYFGDINDFRKYGLLRSLLRAGNVKLLVVWMLTGEDHKKPGDGKFTRYLNEAKKYSACDPELHGWLHCRVHEEGTRAVSLIEGSDLLGNTTFYSKGLSAPPLVLIRGGHLLHGYNLNEGGIQPVVN